MELPNFLREDLGTVVRYSPLQPGADGLVFLTNLRATELDGEIQRHVSHFQAMGVGFEWKVYGSDEPKCLTAKLLEVGFAQGEREALMIYEVSSFGPTGGAGLAGIDVRKVNDLSGLKQIVDLQERIWGRPFGWLLDQLRSTWDHTSFYAAYAQDRIVGSGWIEYPKGSQFPELHGGAVLPDFRGTGIYSRLFESRVLEAVAAGVKWIAVDASPMSRPILQARGFQTLDTTCPMTWSFRASA